MNISLREDYLFIVEKMNEKFIFDWNKKNV